MMLVFVGIAGAPAKIEQIGPNIVANTCPHLTQICQIKMRPAPFEGPHFGMHLVKQKMFKILRSGRPPKKPQDENRTKTKDLKTQDPRAQDPKTPRPKAPRPQDPRRKTRKTQDPRPKFRPEMLFKTHPKCAGNVVFKRELSPGANPVDKGT